MTATISIQSVIYTNSASDLIRAAVAASNAARVARDSGLLADWQLRLGDGSPAPMLNEAHLASITEIVSDQGGTLIYDVFGENIGSAAGHNRLAQGSEADYLVILNPDALMDPSVLHAMLLRAQSDIGFIEARQLPLDHPKEYDTVSGDTDWGSTACAMIPRELFESLQGFDSETFFLYCDDVDFSWRVRLAGKRVVYAPEARLFHDKRLTITADWPSSNAERYYSAEAALLLAYKYSRDDILDGIVQAFRSSDDEHLTKALMLFEERLAIGRLPERIDPDHQVARFVAGNYTMHRF